VYWWLMPLRGAVKLVRRRLRICRRASSTSVRPKKNNGPARGRASYTRGSEVVELEPGLWDRGLDTVCDLARFERNITISRKTCGGGRA